MRAVVQERYGADGLALRDVDVPQLEPHQVLVRVRATSINPAEWYRVQAPLFVRIMGRYGLRAPKSPFLGGDLAGTVEAVGADVSGFAPGDDVFGTSGRSWAEYAPSREPRLARKPENVSFEEAAGVPIAGLTALQAVRDHGRVEPGQRVLVNGGAGGVGTFAVQLAKHFGAEVTAVCSTRNVDLVGSLGADRVYDYTREDFTRSGELYDVLLDVAGNRPLRELRRVLAPDATVVAIGAPMSASPLGPLPHIAAKRVAAIGRSQKVTFFVAKIERNDLAFMADLLAAGTVRSIVDRTYELERVGEALDYLGTRHARAKVVLTV